MSHTPGPWRPKLSRLNGEISVVVGKGSAMREIARVRSEEDALLIAEVPNLLACLSGLVAALDAIKLVPADWWNSPQEKALAAARTAIAKASAP